MVVLRWVSQCGQLIQPVARLLQMVSILPAKVAEDPHQDATKTITGWLFRQLGPQSSKVTFETTNIRYPNS